jgi:hypothetical protein
VRLGVEVLAHVDQGNAGIDLDAGREVPAADRAGDREGALRGVDDRPQPESLLDDGVEVAVFGFGVELGA